MRKPNYDSAMKTEFLDKLRAHFDKDVISLKELNAYCENKKNKVENFPYFILRERKVGRGQFNIVSSSISSPISKPAAAPVAQAASALSSGALARLRR